MPRKPSNPHVLRTVRGWGKLSQPALARLVDVEPITIRKIENGDLKPSRKLAHRIATATGINPNQIIENFDPETPYSVMGPPEVLTEENWKTRFREMQGASEKIVGYCKGLKNADHLASDPKTFDACIRNFQRGWINENTDNIDVLCIDIRGR